MNGIINLHKPPGITSHQAVAKIKRLLGAKKAGHAGTLDPLATGVLLICLNEATKISRFLLDMDKQYHATLKLGETTDTLDADGTVLSSRDISGLGEKDIMDAVLMFRGRIEQRPPMYSAVKIGGETLYKLARKGIEVERPVRSVEIYDIRVISIQLPYLHISVDCSKGTYIRTLCDDIGMKLGVGAHISSLERVSTGSFHLQDSATFEDLLADSASGPENIGPGGKYFTSIDAALAGLREIILDDATYKKAVHGVPIMPAEINGLSDDCFVRLKGPSGNLFGIGRVHGGSLLIERLLNLGAAIPIC